VTTADAGRIAADAKFGTMTLVVAVYNKTRIVSLTDDP
jgi:hypothetical protein